MSVEALAKAVSVAEMTNIERHFFRSRHPGHRAGIYFAIKTFTEKYGNFLTKLYPIFLMRN